MYQFTHYKRFNYKKLEKIRYIRRAGKSKKERFADCVMMLDTETSKKSKEHGKANHVVAFTLSIRSAGKNICTLWGRKPSEAVQCIDKIIKHINADNFIIYVHNLAYDYMFLRKFFFSEWGLPEKALNTKSHYPIVIEWDNGVILKDSLILAQKSLEKWAKDLNVEHKKAVGSWDYDKLRGQNENYTTEELHYIENDTLAGVECIDTLRKQLHHHIYSMPYTATGIVREAAYKISKENHGFENFQKLTPDFDIYMILEQVFHGGYCHANRHIIDEILSNIIVFDFKSSYPFVMLTEKYPMTRFKPFKYSSIDDLLQLSVKYAFITKLILVKPRLKKDVVMPVLQFSKAVKTINAVIDNGRILCAGYVEIYCSEITLDLIKQQYDFEAHICTEVHYARKAYLPRWFTDFVFDLFKKKCELDGVDPLNYVLAKASLNSCYGMCVQKAIQNDIEENYLYYDGDERHPYETTSNYTPEKYEKYRNNRRKFLPFQWGCWVTEYAMKNLFTVGQYCENWVYSDTDSVFGYNWSMEKIRDYNKSCVEKLAANGYGSVTVNGKVFTLGVAELDKKCNKFKTLGAKRYCYTDKEEKDLHITVAGVPKSGVKCLKNDMRNFRKDFVFDGITTGKLQHKYIYEKEIYTDENGNETGDSIDLCYGDYVMDKTTCLDWERIFDEEITIQNYEIGG